MDWPRILRALDAGKLERIEERRQAMIGGDVKQDDIKAEEWAAIVEHDELYAEWMERQEGSEEAAPVE